MERAEGLRKAEWQYHSDELKDWSAGVNDVRLIA